MGNWSMLARPQDVTLQRAAEEQLRQQELNLRLITQTTIDDRKRAEDRLRQSEAELRTITDTIRQPIGLGEELDETGGDGGGIPARQVVARTRYRHCVDFWNPLLQ